MNGYYEKRTFHPSFPFIARGMNSPMKFRSHWQESVEMLCFLTGFQRMTMGEKSVDVGPGCVLMVPPGYLHSFSGGSMKCRGWMLIFPPTIPDLAELSQKTGFLSSCWMLQEVITPYEAGLLDKLALESSEEQAFHVMASKALLNLFLSLLARRWLSDRDRGDPRLVSIMEGSLRSIRGIEKIKKAIAYLEDNYTENITLDLAAAAVNFEKHHFCRLFKRITGLTFFDYLNAYRVERAERDLAALDIPVTEAALKNGFGNINSFERIFKAYHGCTPSEFRKANANIR